MIHITAASKRTQGYKIFRYNASQVMYLLDAVNTEKEQTLK